MSCARGAQLSRLSDAWSPRWRARGEKERQFHAGGRTKETTYASRCINELARLLHVTTKAPMRRTRQRHAAVLNMRSVTKVVGRAFPLLYIVGDHARGFHRGLAELGVAGDLTLDALTFGMQEVAQAFELGNQSFDL